MGISTELQARCESKCELCGAQSELNAFTVPPKRSETLDDQIAVCNLCLAQIENPEKMDAHHWRCLNESMWSQVPAVQVMSYRMLEKLNTEGWAVYAIGMMYMDEETMEWAQSTNEEIKIIHKDCNGNILKAGDTVTLIKDLNVKGASFTAKRGVAVRRIRLDPEHAEHIEGKIDGQQIVILTKYVKKS